MNKHVSRTAPTWPMSSEKVNFTNGMLVVADDLKAAMQYPVSLMQITNRAVYGCGVICGFDLKPDPGLCDTRELHEFVDCDGNEAKKTVFPSFRVEVGPGTAMDCHGMPIELCKPVLIDLAPEVCGCDPKLGGTICILVRHIEAHESPRGECCGGGTPECSRIRDHIEIKGFTVGADDMPDHFCARPQQEKADECKPDRRTDPEKPMSFCECMKKCDDCTCCGEGWVLIGCVELTSHGIVAWEVHPEDAQYKKMLAHRKYIKTIECACPPVGEKKKEEEASGEQTGEKQIPQFLRPASGQQSQMIEVIEKTITTTAHREFIVASKPKDLDEVVTTLEAIEKAPDAANKIFKAEFIRSAPGYREKIRQAIEAEKSSGKNS